MALGKENDDRTHAEILALQELVCADIAFFKNQQWQAAYYGLALYAALAAIPGLEGLNPSEVAYVVLWLVAVGILITGLYVLAELESALIKRRELLPFARKHFTQEALIAYGAGDPNAALKTAADKVSLKRVFVGVYIVGFVFASWILALGWARA